MGILKTIFLGPKKPKGPDPTLIRSSRLQAERAREEEKRLEEEARAQVRRAFNSGRILLFGAGSRPAGGTALGGGVPGTSQPGTTTTSGGGSTGGGSLGGGGGGEQILSTSRQTDK